MLTTFCYKGIHGKGLPVVILRSNWSMDRIEVLKKNYYPDNSKNGTLIFYNWIRQSIQDDFVVLNVGAGPTADARIRSLRGEVRQVVGVDIDDSVLRNADLDQGVVLKNENFPFTDNYFDMAWADYVLEHVENPGSFLAEVKRVLKPGASFFFRTPNKYHYVSLIGRATPHWFHELVANRARGLSTDAHEPYPTYYSLNCKTQILEYAYSSGFRHVEMQFIEAEPSYLVFSPIAFRMGVAYERLVNHYHCLSGLRANIFGRLRK